jgi:hypothetical protein
MRDPDRSEVVVAGEQVAAEQLAAMLRGVLGEIDAGRLAGDPAPEGPPPGMDQTVPAAIYPTHPIGDNAPPTWHRGPRVQTLSNINCAATATIGGAILGVLATIIVGIIRSKCTRTVGTCRRYPETLQKPSNPPCLHGAGASRSRAHWSASDSTSQSRQIQGWKFDAQSCGDPATCGYERNITSIARGREPLKPDETPRRRGVDQWRARRSSPYRSAIGPGTGSWSTSARTR